MKLAVCYNVFEDSLEHLKASIEQIRAFPNIVAVVYQKVSNHGNKQTWEYEKYLEHLKSIGLIDDILCYTPSNSLSVHRNEMEKRKIGRDIALLTNCTHWLSMDSDEYYYPEEFKKAIRKMDKKGYDATACCIQDYHSSPNYVVNDLQTYYVPFISKVKCQYNFGASYFKYVDPTRGVTNYNEAYCFRPDEIIMHHMTTVRLDLKSKYLNSSARVNMGSLDNIQSMVDRITTYDPYDLRKDDPICGVVDDYFKVKDSFDYYVDFKRNNS